MSAFSAMMGVLFTHPDMSLSGVYVPAFGDEVDVRVLRSDVARETDFGGVASAVQAAVRFEIRVSELAQVRVGEHLRIGNAVWRIMSFQKDAEGLTWMLDVDPVR